MPIYEYACPACGHVFDVIQKIADPLVAACPECGGKVERRVSSPALQFKGSGFYITDYAKGKPPGKGGAKGGETPKAAPKPDAGGEKKGKKKAGDT